MKHLSFFKSALLTLLILCSNFVWAHDFEVDGIYYNILSETDKTVEVTFKGSSYNEYSEYTGCVDIPSTVRISSGNCVIKKMFEAWTSINHDNNSSSSIIYTIEVVEGYALIFDWEVSSESGYDWLIITLDGDKIIKKSGEHNGTFTKVFDSAGTHTLVVEYIKDASTNKGNDRASIHNIKIGPEIPEGTYNVISIGDYAFCYCSSLESIRIPSNVTYVGSYAFYNCSSLNKVDINDLAAWCNIDYCDYWSLPLSYAKNLYLNGELVTELVIPESVAVIKDYAFYSCGSLSSVTIPNNVKNIGYRAFEDCSGLKDVIIGNGVTEIGNSAFSNCNLLQNVTIGNGVTSIGWNAFFMCYWLANIEIPKSVTSIGMDAFFCCTRLKNIYFCSNPTIGTSAIPSTTTCNLILDDENAMDFNVANTNTYADVSYSRTISEGKYGTIMLPFAPDAASLENYAFYALAESGDGYMRFEEIATPVANTPYIYTLREGKENVAITGGETTISSNIVTPEIDGWQTIGSFSNQTIDTSNDNYYALSATDNEINRITKNLTVLPYRAYFKSSNASKSALSIYISGTTGVKEISSSEIDGFENGGIFDLSGRKVAKPINGIIYIKNGKKIMF